MSVSDNRVPKAKITSALRSAWLATVVPTHPLTPKEREWASGIELLPIDVVATGIFIDSAKAMRAELACPRLVPPPAKITGFFADLSSSNARAVACASPRVREFGTKLNTSSGKSTSANCVNASWVISI